MSPDYQEAVKTWQAAKGVIGQFLKEMASYLTPEEVEHNATAILARLASHKPPLLVSFGDESAPIEKGKP